MNKDWLSKEKLLQYLLMVSIVVIGIVGLYYLNLLANDAWKNISNAVQSVLIPFVIAFFLSIIIGPLALLFEKKLKMKKNFSIVLAILIGSLIILGIITILVVFLISQMSSIIGSLIGLVDNPTISSILTQLNDGINLYFQNSNLSSIIDEIMNNGATVERIISVIGTIVLSISGIASSVFSIIMIFALTPVFLFYLIKEKKLIFTSISNVFPHKTRVHVIELGKLSDQVIKNYFRASGIMMLVVFIYFGITLSILSFFIPDFGIMIAIVFALFMGLFSIIPYIGAWIGLAAPIIYLLTKHLENYQNPELSQIYLIAILIILANQIIEQILESSIVQPHIVGKQVHIHPLAVISSLIFFGGLFGFAGVLLAVPLAGTIKAAILYIKGVNIEDEHQRRIASNPEKPSRRKKKTVIEDNTND